ncbi:MAG: hypothetical protein MH204_00430, partial [Fimbriimonadaceae bacterium]|nr:hypothetical protein [Fimbriimonadaceae bacterium]
MLTAMLPLLALTSVRDVPVSSGDAAALRSAVESAGPGVRIRLAAGRYRLDRPLRIEASGREGAWIEIVGPEAGEAVI